MKHKSSRNFNGIKQVLLSKKLQRVLAVVLVFSLMVSTPGSIWGQGMLGVGAQGEEQIPPASSSTQPNNETAPPVSSTSVPIAPSEPNSSTSVPVAPSEPNSSTSAPVAPSEPNSSTSVPVAPSEPASTPKTPEHKGVQPIVPPSAAVVAVGDLIAKLPDAVPQMPTDTQENYDAWANGIRSYSDTIKALDTSFTALTQDEKALLTKAQLDKKDAWVNALAGLPTALAAEVTLSSSSAYKTLEAAYNAVAAGGTIHVIGTVPVNSTTVITKPITITSDDGNGVLKRAKDNDDTLITVANGGDLIIENVALDGGAVYGGDHTVNVANATNGGGECTGTKYGEGQLIWLTAGGKLTLNNKAILCNNALVGTYDVNTNNAHHFGSAVNVNGGDFVMNTGAAITNNLVSGYAADGAAISNIVNTGSVTINGGTISNNYGERLGSAIRISGGAFNIFGGSITNNHMPASATTNNAPPAGAIYVDNVTNNNINIKGDATIENNDVANLNIAAANVSLNVQDNLTGGNVYVTANGRMNTGSSFGKTNSKTGIDKIKRDISSTSPIAASAIDNKGDLQWGTNTELYVGGAGASATGNGSFATPYDSINAAIAAVPNGGTIYVKGNVNCSASVAHTAKAFTIESCDNTGKKITEILKPNDVCVVK